LLLDYLQAECEKFNFRRETYYLCQSYVDTYLDSRTIKLSLLQKLGLACMHIAMKIEEVDLVSLRDILRPMQANTSPIFKVGEIEQMEREVVSILNFKLLPDTLYFWFEYAVKMWDLYVSHEALHQGFKVFKPQEVRKDLNSYDPKLHKFQLSDTGNRYRAACRRSI